MLRRGPWVCGVSVSLDGDRGAALTFLPTANRLMVDLFEYHAGSWEISMGSLGGPEINFTMDETSRGVLRFLGEAPTEAIGAVIAYKGEEHRVPMSHRHLLF